jgi:hypothetical protein
MALATKAPQPPPDPDLYEADYYAWLVHNAALIRAGRADEADLAHIAEELEDMGRSEKRALGSHLVIVLQHLLKWQLQPTRRSTSWRLSIDNARDAIEELLAESPTLRRKVPEAIQGKFAIARRNAITETGLPASGVPETCPYTPEQILDPSYWPGQ